MSWSIFPASEFQNFSNEWKLLNEASGNCSLLQPDFISSALDEFKKGGEILAIHRSRNALTAMGIFSKSSRGSWQSFQPSVAPLGAWLQNPEMSTAELLGGLISELPGFNLLVAVSQQDPSLLPRPLDHSKLITLDYISTARVKISGEFESYWNSLSKNLRHNTKRQRNRLIREDIQPRFEVITDPSEIAGAVTSYAMMESAGWKGRLGTAVGVGDSQSRFYTNLLEKFCYQKKGMVFQLWYNERLVAANLCIHDDGSLIILKTTYDENETSTSPAQLLRQEVIKKIFDEGQFHNLEFYGPVGDWHRRLTSDIRTIYHTNYYRWAMVSAFHKQRFKQDMVGSDSREKSLDKSQ